RLADGARLLVNLFEHEVFESALFSHNRIPSYPLTKRRHGIAFEIGRYYAVAREHGHLAVAQEKYVARVIEHGRYIGSDEVFIVAETDYDGRALPDGYDFVLIVGRHHGESEDAFQFGGGAAHGLFEIGTLFPILFDQVSDGFSIGFGDELMILF